MTIRKNIIYTTTTSSFEIHTYVNICIYIDLQWIYIDINSNLHTYNRQFIKREWHLPVMCNSYHIVSKERQKKKKHENYPFVSQFLTFLLYKTTSNKRRKKTLKNSVILYLHVYVCVCVLGWMRPVCTCCNCDDNFAMTLWNARLRCSTKGHCSTP